VDRKRKNVNDVVYGSDPAREIVEKHYAQNKPSGAYKGCAVYLDYRELLDKEKDLDAVMVATPDHAHTVVSIAAMKKGKHVFCQKPLTQSVYEARQMAEVSRQAKVATQCGTSNYTSEGAYRMREMLADGAIGPVREVHNWSNRPVWPQGIERPKDTPPVPEGLDWNLWLGPAPERPYHPAYLPFVWRGWWDFGTGALGDMGCYSFDVIVRALGLGLPTRIEACGSRLHGKPNTDSFPQASIVRYEFPARGNQPAVRLTWYDGGLVPERPEELDEGQPLSEWNGGLLFVGEKGKMLCDFVGTNPRLIPASKMNAYGAPPKTLPRSIGHKEEWIRACQGGEPPGANFQVAGHVSEILALGNIALGVGKELRWDATGMKVTNVPEANPYVRRPYREGWTL
jgi:predicted dehydrogenase